MSLKSLFEDAPDLVPQYLRRNMSLPRLIELMGHTCFEARNLYRGAELYREMVNANDVIWLGIAGAGIAGGMGGYIISLLDAGFIDVICSTGAQVYHDLHFAFDLPVKSISPHWDDNLLREHGDTRIYDIGIRDVETLQRQDDIIQDFVRETYSSFPGEAVASWQFNYRLGQWVLQKAAYPGRSFVAQAARLAVPIFWDSHSNHSIAMNLAKLDREGFSIKLSAQKDIFESAAIVYGSAGTGFVELGGGGPKNFIQQTGPTISQILGIAFEGADRGIQIGTAIEREGSLSGCTFGEAVTWGKYHQDDREKLVQIWGEYSIIFPLLGAYVLELDEPRPSKEVIKRLPAMIEQLSAAQ
jgi:deoxyhypusine synthase